MDGRDVSDSSPPFQVSEYSNTRQIDSKSGDFSLDILVIHARDLPRSNILLRRPFYVTVTNGETIESTGKAWSRRGVTVWNETFHGLAIRSHAEKLGSITFTLYKNRFFSRDIAVGNCVVEPAGPSLSNLPLILNPSTPRAKQQPTALRIRMLTPLTAELGDTLHDAVGNIQTAPKCIPKSPMLISAEDETRKSTYGSWLLLLERIKFVVNIVDRVAQIHPYAAATWAVFSAIPKAMIHQVEQDHKVRRLLSLLQEVYDDLHDAEELSRLHEDPRRTDIMIRMMNQTKACGDFILSYTRNTSYWSRLLNNLTSDSDGPIEAYSAALKNVHQSFIDNTVVNTAVFTLRVANNLEVAAERIKEISENIYLRELRYGGDTWYNPKKCCYPGTRTRFLDAIGDWIHNPGSPKLLVLFGQAGSGKSTIAHEIASRCEKMGCLASSFVFTRGVLDRKYESLPQLLITSLAVDLADRNLAFKDKLVDTIRNDTSLRRGNRDCETLLKRLVVDPLKELTLVGPSVVVIDALDQCGAMDEQGTLASEFADAASSFPDNISVLITARSESHLERVFCSRVDVVLTLRMDDKNLAMDVEEDIRRYIKFKLSQIISDDKIDTIAERAGSSFQWASVACEYIANARGYTPEECVERILDNAHPNNVQSTLDELYKTILRSTFPEFQKDGQISFRFRLFMGLILTAMQPLSAKMLVGIATYWDSDAQSSFNSSIAHLGSLLSNVANENEPLVPLHASFRDFLTDEDRSGIFYVDEKPSHGLLAESCMRSMLTALRFNMCNLESSALLNSEIVDLKARVDANISRQLQYACRYWCLHLAKTDLCDKRFEMVRLLLNKKVLFWLEALSLINAFDTASSSLNKLGLWISKANPQAEILHIVKASQALVNDAVQFSDYFEAVIMQSTPHLYISALPFSPSSSTLREQYLSRFTDMLQIPFGQLENWSATENDGTSRDNVPWLTSIAVSSDGRVFACSKSGSPLIYGITDSFSASLLDSGLDSNDRVFVSPDSSVYAVLHSSNVALRSTDTHELLGEFDTHIGRPDKLSFSRNGRCFAVSDWDKTGFVGRVSETGEPVGQKFDWKSVSSLAVSSTGNLIALGKAFGRMIKIVDAQSGKTLTTASGHTNKICEIAFSSDDRLLASAAWDNTVRTWDTTTGACVQVLEHPRHVLSVAFSPDGSTIASGTHRGGVWLWDAQTGGRLAGPLYGCTDKCVAVAFHPSGQSFFSASRYGSIREWNVAPERADAPTTLPAWNKIDWKGWVRGPDDELLFWVPPFHRRGLLRPNNKRVLGERVTRLDLSRFVYGVDWSKCFRDSE